MWQIACPNILPGRSGPVGIKATLSFISRKVEAGLFFPIDLKENSTYA
jgi:hypothetical protein